MGICCNLQNNDYIHKDSKAVHLIDNFVQNVPNKTPIRQNRTDEVKTIKIQEFKKLPGQACEVSFDIANQKRIRKGKSTDYCVRNVNSTHNVGDSKRNTNNTNLNPNKVDTQLSVANMIQEMKPNLFLKKHSIEESGNNISSQSRKWNNEYSTNYDTGQNQNINILNNNQVQPTPAQNPFQQVSPLESTHRKIKVTEREISTKEQEKIKEIFHHLFLFESFPDEVLDIILSSLFLMTISKGDYLYQKGSTNKFFYIVWEGKLEVYDDTPEHTVIKTYLSWDSFGHSSLMVRDRFITVDNTIMCAEDAKLFVLDGDTFLSFRQRIITLHCQERYNFLNTIIFFKSLNSILKHVWSEKMQMTSFKEGEKIISKGEKDMKMYLIKKGKVICQINGIQIKVLGVSSYFGIIGALMKTERTCDVYAKEATTCFVWTIDDFIETWGNNYTEDIWFSWFKEVIYENSYLSDWITEDNIANVFKTFVTRTYKGNDPIHGSGTNRLNTKRVILVIEGNFYNWAKKRVEYKAGEWIGEQTWKNNVDIPSHFIAYPDAFTIESNLSDISEHWGEEFRTTTMNLLYKVSKYKSMAFFNRISDNSLKWIVDSLKKDKWYKNEIIIEENTNAEKDYFYIITKGTVEVSKNGDKLRELEKGSTFGELGWINENGFLRTATVKAVGSVHCTMIPRKEFVKIMNDKYVSTYLKEQISLKNDTVDLGSITLIKHWDNGKFGNVDWVYDTSSGNVYSMKAINRKNADIRKRIASYIVSERSVMLSLDHPFICKFVKTFKNEYFVFFLMEFINGISFKTWLDSKLKVFNLNDSRFYIASILLAVEHLHKKKIVHRDIKPSNIMINYNGYIKWIDFGTSKFMSDYTNTIIGTPHYMAPEVLAGKGYSYSCDFWSIGVCAYEMFYNRYPFGNDGKEVLEIYNDILYNEFRFPFENIMFSPLNNFIKSMLLKKEHKRLCSFSKIKDLEFFDDFDWESLGEQRTNLAIFIPNSMKIDLKNMNKYQLNYEEEWKKNAIYSGAFNEDNEKVDTSWDYVF